MVRRSPSSLLLLTATLTACAGTPEPTAEALRDARALIAAEPAAWPEQSDAVLAHGDAATPALVAAIRDQRHGPGEVCAIALLGAQEPRDASIELLIELLADGGEAGTEAALALGNLRADVAVPALRHTLDDAEQQPGCRTAAAVSLLALGQDRPAADFIAAILVAGTPYGQEAAKRYALPDKSRWALERYLAIRGLRVRCDGEDFGLDPDAPWPDLEDGRRRFLDWLEIESR